jgi:hypothetical protein
MTATSLLHQSAADLIGFIGRVRGSLTSVLGSCPGVVESDHVSRMSGLIPGSAEGT